VNPERIPFARALAHRSQTPDIDARWTPTEAELAERVAEVREAKLEFKRTGKPPALLIEIYGSRRNFVETMRRMIG
jgi:hypothetical protein